MERSQRWRSGTCPPERRGFFGGLDTITVVTPDNAATRQPAPRRRNGLLWAGGLLIVVALLSNILFFLRLPGQAIFPWLNLALFVVPVVLLVMGLRRAITQPETYRGKAGGWILTALSVLLLAFAVFAFYKSRDIPNAASAPKVGAKAPDFVLPDTSGRSVGLSDLLSMPMDNGAPPKAVLLVFYRGYW
ncbi:MAG TPA: hypothetical protein VF532_15605 [Candidatus Angelobacter sp.]